MAYSSNESAPGIAVALGTWPGPAVTQAAVETAIRAMNKTRRGRCHI